MEVVRVKSQLYQSLGVGTILVLRGFLINDTGFT